MRRETAFPLALSCILLAVALVAIVSIAGPFATVSEDNGNVVGHPFSTDGGYDVTLVSPDPVYVYTQIPFPSPHGYIPWRIFERIIYVPDTKQFIASGICHPGNGGQSRYGHRFGMYAISDAGQFIGTRDVCIDTSTAHAGDWCGATTQRCTNMATDLLPLSAGRFVRVMALWGGSRPTTVYTTTGTGMERYAQTPLVDPDAVSPDDLSGPYSVATASNRLIGMAQPANSGPVNVMYSLPDLQLITSFPYEYRPIIGVGEYFVGFRNNGGSGASGWEYAVYRMPAIGTTKPARISTFTNKIIIGSGVVDALDPNRIGIVLKDKTTGAQEFVIYTAGADGLVEESRRSLPARWMGTMSAPQDAMAGPYLFYGRCTSTSQMLTERSESCKVFVEKDGADLAVEQLPRDGEGRRLTVVSSAISDTGRVLVSTNGYTSIASSSIGRLFLYEISGFNGSAAPPAPACTGDGDCLTGRCVDGACAAECVTDGECTGGEVCADNRCVAGQTATARFVEHTTSCGSGFPRIFCITDVSWTSEGEGAIQLVQQGGRQRACAPAGVPMTKRIITTDRSRTYQLYAASDCESEPGLLLDAITAQANRD